MKYNKVREKWDYFIFNNPNLASKSNLTAHEVHNVMTIRTYI